MNFSTWSIILIIFIVLDSIVGIIFINDVFKKQAVSVRFKNFVLVEDKKVFDLYTKIHMYFLSFFVLPYLILDFLEKAIIYIPYFLSNIFAFIVYIIRKLFKLEKEEGISNEENDKK